MRALLLHIRMSTGTQTADLSFLLFPPPPSSRVKLFSRQRTKKQMSLSRISFALSLFFLSPPPSLLRRRRRRRLLHYSLSRGHFPSYLQLTGQSLLLLFFCSIPVGVRCYFVATTADAIDSYFDGIVVAFCG
jgi:hypothetical protein